MFKKSFNYLQLKNVGKVLKSELKTIELFVFKLHRNWSHMFCVILKFLFREH